MQEIRNQDRLLKCSVDSVVREYHVYKEIWTPRVGERLPCREESSNINDMYAVLMEKKCSIVGHVPKKQYQYRVTYFCTKEVK